MQRGPAKLRLLVTYDWRRRREEQACGSDGGYSKGEGEGRTGTSTAVDGQWGWMGVIWEGAARGCDGRPA